MKTNRSSKLKRRPATEKRGGCSTASICSEKMSESQELAVIRSLSSCCKKCGEPKEYAKQYGCPQARRDCPHAP